jgi:hypothetical protein
MRKSNNPYVTVPDNLDVAATAGSDDFQNGNVSQETLQHDNAEEQEFEAEQHKKDFYGVLEPPPQKAYFNELQEDELMNQVEPELKVGVPELKEAVPEPKPKPKPKPKQKAEPEPDSETVIHHDVTYNDAVKNSLMEQFISKIKQDKKLSNTKIKNLTEKKIAYIRHQIESGGDIDKTILRTSDISDIPTKGWRV